MTELLNCPFCGYAAVSRPHEEMPDSFIAGCSDPDCIAHGAAFDFITEETAISAWNRRATPSPWRPDRKQIADALFAAYARHKGWPGSDVLADAVLTLWLSESSLPPAPSTNHFPDATKLVEPSHTVAQSHTALSQPPSGGAELEALKQAAREFYWANPTPLHQAARAYAASVGQGNSSPAEPEIRCEGW